MLTGTKYTSTSRAYTSAAASSTQSVSAIASAASTTVSPTQFTSTASVSSATPTVISFTQYPSGSITVVDLTTYEAITSQNNDGFIPVEEPAATQAVCTTQQKKRGRLRGSRDKQPRKRRTIIGEAGVTQ
jgi:hypothetical protein